MRKGWVGNGEFGARSSWGCLKATLSPMQALGGVLTRTMELWPHVVGAALGL